jgi:hypothetical protein
MFKDLAEKFKARVAEVRELNRQAHQGQEHLSDAEMQQPDAMKKFAAFKKK